MTIINSISQETWREFVDAHPQGNVFHTPEMYQVFQKARGYQPRLWATVDDSGQLLALFLPVQVTLWNGLLRRLTSRSIAYGSVLCDPCPAGEQALAALLHVYSREAWREVLFTELRNLADLNPLQPMLAQCGFVYEDHLNYLIDLNCSPEELLQQIGSRTRKHIRQAIRRGKITIEQVTDRDQISFWYELVQESYSTARVPLAERSLFESAFEVFQPRGMIQFWLAKFGRTYVAASAELLYKDVIYGWFSGVDRVYANETPSELLMWEVLQWGAKNGFKTYDFGGAGKPDETYGVRNFKAKFGGQLVCYGRNKQIHSPNLLRWSERGYAVYRRLAGYL